MNTTGFLHDVWAAVDRVGGTIIDNEQRQAERIKFASEKQASEFVEIAGNEDIWFNPIRTKLVTDGSDVVFVR